VFRYRSEDEDSARWQDFTFRPGDIVISTRSKSGTTWMQMICALLVFQTPDLPGKLTDLSPWLDWLVIPRDQMFARLEGQRHRRFIKTHTPLDGVPMHPAARYLVVARHPLDMAVSLYHQGANIDRARLRELTGAPPAAGRPRPPVPVADWLSHWISGDADPRQSLDSLPGVLMHLSDAWQRRHEPNVLLVHYDDLLSDLDGEMRRVAAFLGIETAPAATFAEMKQRADQLTPNAAGVLKSNQAFFRQGRSRAGRDLLSAAELERYTEVARSLAPADLLAWLHR
jgi:aryl sulfotransferase